MKKWITKVIIILIAISLFKISYGYWTEELSLKGKATLLVQVSVMDKVKKTVVKKTDETIDKKENNEKEDTKKTKEDTNKDTKIDTEEEITLTKDSSLNELDKKVIADQKVIELDKNQKELQDAIVTESSKNDTTVEINKDTQPQDELTEVVQPQEESNDDTKLQKEQPEVIQPQEESTKDTQLKEELAEVIQPQEETTIDIQP